MRCIECQSMYYKLLRGTYLWTFNYLNSHLLIGDRPQFCANWHLLWKKANAWVYRFFLYTTLNCR